MFTLEEYDKHYAELQDGYEIQEVEPINGERMFEVVKTAEETIEEYNERMKLSREQAYRERSDKLISRKIRKQAIGEWTDEDENEFKQQMKTISEEIDKEFAYKE